MQTPFAAPKAKAGGWRAPHLPLRSLPRLATDPSGFSHPLLLFLPQIPFSSQVVTWLNETNPKPQAPWEGGIAVELRGLLLPTITCIRSHLLLQGAS